MLGARACIGRLIAYLLQIDYELAIVEDSVSKLQPTPTYKTLNANVDSRMDRG